MTCCSYYHLFYQSNKNEIMPNSKTTVSAARCALNPLPAPASNNAYQEKLTAAVSVRQQAYSDSVTALPTQSLPDLHARHHDTESINRNWVMILPARRHCQFDYA